MKKARPKIPKSVAEKVLKEFNHLCSVCGAPKPQIHHIDEDRENNDPLNILPLCPNCHLTDQHNPTSKIRPAILALFRVHKDPSILTPQFEPIFARLDLLGELIMSQSNEPANCVWPIIWKCIDDLCGFVSHLELGHYYSNAFKTKFQESGLVAVQCDGEDRDISLETLMKGVKKWGATRGNLEKLLVEMLRYQSWNCTPNRFKRSSRPNPH